MKEVCFMDCIGMRCKNLQILLSIEIFYDIKTNDEFVIEYNFHKEDFDVWLQIYNEHINNVNNYKLYDINGLLLTKPENKYELFYFKVISKDSNLYRNIRLIPFIEDNKFINMNESVYNNSWYNEIIAK